MRRLSIQIADSDEEGVRLLQELGFKIVDRAELDILEGIDELTMELDADAFRRSRPEQRWKGWQKTE